jgi:putative ABC transport system permease protein
MWKNYLITAFRNIIRQKGFSVINILGLAIGMTVSVLILLWVLNEISYDKYHAKADRLYSLVQTQHYTSGPLTTDCMPMPISDDIRADFPEIVNSFMYYQIPVTVANAEDAFVEDLLLADSGIFEMLDINFIYGEPKSVFKDPSALVITREIAEKHFGNENPIGLTLKMNNAHNYKITGVVENFPDNTFMQFDYCVPFFSIENFGYSRPGNYGNNSYHVVAELHPDANMAQVNEKINNFIQEKARVLNPDYDSDIDLFLFPFVNRHLHSIRGSGGNITNVYILSAIAIFIIIIACVNYMNLATARSIKRSREIGLRKTLGASRKQIIIQFFSESILLTLFSFVLAMGLVYCLLPAFNQLADKELAFNLLNGKIILGLLGLLLLIAFLSGSYPALYMASFKPMSVLREFSSGGTKSLLFRRVLVVFQFAISVILIICTIVIVKQLDYIHEKDLGFNNENVLAISMRGNSTENFDVLKNTFLENPNIISVTRANAIPFWIGSNSGGMDWEDKDSEDDLLIGFTYVDVDYPETIGVKMAEGRFFSKDIQSDTNAVILNQNAVKAMGMENPVGKWISWGEDSRIKIVGVVQDFNFLPLNYEISPLSMYYEPSRCRMVFTKIDGNNMDQAIDYMEKSWDKINGEFPFKYTFLDSYYERTYSDERRISRLFKYFSLMAIFISCLGLFGLAAFMAEQRTKEIGIRKVLGAQTGTIINLMTKSFLKWVIVSNIIAWPVAWYFMDSWLQDYAYHTKLHWWIFAFATFLSLLIAILTVIFQAIRASMRNPANALKYE